MTTPKKYKAAPKFGLCLDWETSGSTWGEMQYAKDWQGLSFGAVIFDFKTLSPVETLYREIKYYPNGPAGDKNWGWSMEAQNIHGLTREHLEKHGVEHEEAACDLGSLILEYFGPKAYIPFLGHNRNFDEAFTRQLLEPYGIMPGLFHVHMDTSGLALLTLGVYRSDDLFDFLGLEERAEHNALTDAIYTLEAAKRIRQFVNIGLYGEE